jgi:hypothetical protein
MRVMPMLLLLVSQLVFYGVKFAGADPANGDPIFYEQDGKQSPMFMVMPENLLLAIQILTGLEVLLGTITWKG